MNAVMTQRVALEIGVGEYELEGILNEATRAEIEGQRGRNYHLIKIPAAEFDTYPKDLRGVPTRFCSDSPSIRLWPVPDRDMEMVVEGRPVIVRGPGRPPASKG